MGSSWRFIGAAVGGFITLLLIGLAAAVLLMRAVKMGGEGSPIGGIVAAVVAAGIAAAVLATFTMGLVGVIGAFLWRAWAGTGGFRIPSFPKPTIGACGPTVGLDWTRLFQCLLDRFCGGRSDYGGDGGIRDPRDVVKDAFGFFERGQAIIEAELARAERLRGYVDAAIEDARRKGEEVRTELNEAKTKLDEGIKDLTAAAKQGSATAGSFVSRFV